MTEHKVCKVCGYCITCEKCECNVIQFPTKTTSEQKQKIKRTDFDK